MKIVCAWCEQEGKLALLREVEPLGDDKVTHGLCRLHQLRLKERVTVMRQARHASPAPVRADVAPGRHASAPAASVEVLELEQAPHQLEAWIARGQTLLQMIRRVEATERRYTDLRHDVAQLRREVAALEAEHRTLAELRARAVTLLQRLASDTSLLMLEPLHQLLARLETGCRGRFPAHRPNVPKLRFLRGELVARLLVSPEDVS